MAQVNLDALIPREDFEVKETSSQSQNTTTIQIRDLESGSFFYNVIKKPDFQRETSDWSSEKINDFVKSYIEGDLIPAIILWNSGQATFVIDGAHRLSALISWVHDDYGDGAISRAFFEQNLPKEQIKFAEATRKLIKKSIGTYQEHINAINNPGKYSKDLEDRSKNLATLALQLQWVKGDASKAEDSFFKINQQAVPIDKTELKLLQSRNKPNALSARAIIRSGTGHKYWSKFSEEQQDKIEEVAKEINDILFIPELKTPIKTLDLPLAGRGYSAQTLSLVFDMVNIINGELEKIPDDIDGEQTIRYLKEVKKIMNRISGTHPSSMGLHPVVYFYSVGGRYQPTSFLAIIELMRRFEVNSFFNKFTDIRKSFEDFVLKYKTFVNQINYKWGSGIKGFRRLEELYWSIILLMNEGKNEDEILNGIHEVKTFSFLNPEPHIIEPESVDFSTEVKSATFLMDALKNPLRCKICNGLIHVNSISIDHIVRKADGGIGTVDNAQLTHPYCNTTYKN